jgi:ABC-type transport system involved in cytochrome c biogenesis permease subunit
MNLENLLVLLIIFGVLWGKSWFPQIFQFIKEVIKNLFLGFKATLPHIIKVTQKLLSLLWIFIKWFFYLIIELLKTTFNALQELFYILKEKA